MIKLQILLNRQTEILGQATFPQKTSQTRTDDMYVGVQKVKAVFSPAA